LKVVSMEEIRGGFSYFLFRTFKKHLTLKCTGTFIGEYIENKWIM
jgi:hypothetical protein